MLSDSDKSHADRLPRRTLFDVLARIVRPGAEKQSDDRCVELLRRLNDWPALLDLARMHGVMPVVARNLLVCYADLLPKDIEHELRAARYGGTIRTHVFLRELWGILDDLSAHGIFAMPLKGPVLGAVLYGDPALRECSDLDILVNPDHLEEASEIITRRGYGAAHDSSLAGEQKALIGEKTRHRHLVNLKSGILVELHHEVGYGPLSADFSSQALTESRSDVRVDGRAVPWPSPPVMGVYLCIHGTTHGWNALRWVSDVARFPHVFSADVVRKTIARADALGCGTMCRIAFQLADDIFEAPPAVRETVTGGRRAPIVSPMLRYTMRRQWEGVLEKLCRRALYLAVIDEPHYRRKYLDEMLTPAPPGRDILNGSVVESFFAFGLRLVQVGSRGPMSLIVRPEGANLSD